jgi:hypothetical protein
MVIWFIGVFYQEKSGNPVLDVEVKGDRELVRERQFTSEDVP